jgi:hypothetical protein
MAGTIVADTLQNGAGTSTSMDNAINGSAKAWVSFNGVTTTTIRGSYNVSSVTRTATGAYTVNFSSALTDANYAAVVGFQSPQSNYNNIIQLTYNGTYSSSAFQMFVSQANSTSVGWDSPIVNAVVLR